MTGMPLAMNHSDERFAFGENWRKFLSTLTAERIAQAEASLSEMLAEPLSGRTFLDIGCGSGLFSLAARRKGASVTSFDYDPECVACARELKRRYFAGDPLWAVTRGSVLDPEFMSTCGTFDVVYSWGVLHHTGRMWPAIDAACGAVRPGGQLFIAIYNDQGWKSAAWKEVKRTFNRLPVMFRKPYLFAFAIPFEALAAVDALLRCQPRRLWRRWFHYQSVRGMSRWHDFVDWIGGYPFEVASAGDVLAFCAARGFVVDRVKTVGTKMGCNEFVLRRQS